LRAESSAIEIVSKGTASLAILRLATIYGEGDRGNVAKLIRALDKGRFVWVGSGNNQKSLIYKEDAARGCLGALNPTGSKVEIYNVSSMPATVGHIVATICEALERPFPRFAVPQFFVRAASAILRAGGDPAQLGRRLEKFIAEDVYSGSKFERAFGFHPAIELSEGIRRQVACMRAGQQLGRP
jgi:nucleoside-diphosphate-sugar epimerase